MAEPVVLLVDDDPLNLDILVEALEDQGFALETATDGQQAWEMLLDAPQRYSVIVLDRMMPRLDGLALLKIVKSHPALRDIPVILQTAAAVTHQILEGLQAGAYYYLTKPYDSRVVLSIVKAALADFLYRRVMHAELKAANGSAALMQSAYYQLRTHAEARQLAVALAQCFDEPRRVMPGMDALLSNAIEHGNLGIGYELKSSLFGQNRFEQEVQRRQTLPENQAKWVDVHFRREEHWLTVDIADQGPGFDWAPYLELSAERALKLYGRGIALARQNSFDSLEYQSNGSRVLARCRR